MKKIIIYLSFCLISVFAFNLNTYAGDFELPKYEKFTLKNGLTIYLMEQHEVPLINISGKFMAGAINDTDKLGLANMTASSLMYGTKSYTKQQIEEKLDFIGAYINTYSSDEYAGLQSGFAKKDQDLILDLINEIITKPTFSEEEFNSEKQRKIANLKRAKERPSSVVRNYFNNFIYKDHPYSNPVNGTVNGLENINVNDVQEFYNSYYSPANSCIAIVGDFDSKSMRKKIESTFSGWKNKNAKSINVDNPTFDLKESQVLFVNDDQSRITTFMIGGKGVAVSNPDYVGIEVVNTILGNRFTSWLNSELRINHGLTYGAYSYFDYKKMNGTFNIVSFSSNETTIKALDMALNVVDSLHTHGINEELLLSAKNYIKGGFATDYETSGELAGFLSNMFYYGYDEAFVNDFYKKVDALSLDDINRIIKEHFPKENLQFVMIGKAEEFKDQITKYGKINLKELQEDGY